MNKKAYKNLLANNVWFKAIKSIVYKKASEAVAVAQLLILGDKALSSASQSYAFKAIAALVVKLPLSKLILPALAVGWLLREAYELIKLRVEAASAHDATLREALISAKKAWHLKHLIYYDEDKREIVLADGHVMKSIKPKIACALMQNFIFAKKSGCAAKSLTTKELESALGVDKAYVHRWAYEVRKEFKAHLDSVDVKSEPNDLLTSNGHGGYQINDVMEMLLHRPKMKI